MVNMAQTKMVYQHILVPLLVLFCSADILSTTHKSKDFERTIVRSIPPLHKNLKEENSKPMLKSMFNINRFFRNNDGIAKKNLLKNNVLKCKTDACEKNNEAGSKSLIEDDMPNTVLPNPNIYGGFPENDIWGNFELPPPSILHKLKQELKAAPFYHKQDYGGNQDSTDQDYGYENRAFPEYDVKETPSLLQLMQQNSKSNAPNSALTTSGSLLTTSGCNPADPSCRHIKLRNCAYFLKLCDMTSKYTKQGEIEKEGPCASKILEMFGCRSKIKKGNKLHQATLSHLAPIEKLKEPTKPEDKKVNDNAKYLSETSADSTLNSVQNIENEINKFMEELKKEKTDSTSYKVIKPNDVKEGTNMLQQEITQNTTKVLFHGDIFKNNESKENKTSFSNTTDTENSTNALVNTDKNDGTFSEEDSGVRMFSDWSSWSKCSCLRGSVMRRRNCLLMQCSGATEERKPCYKTQCQRNGTFLLNEINALETLTNILRNSSNKMINSLANSSSNISSISSSSDLINYNLTNILNNEKPLVSAQAFNESSSLIAKFIPTSTSIKSKGEEMKNIVNETSDSASDSARIRSSKKVEEDFIVNSLISRFASNAAQSRSQSQGDYIKLPPNIKLEFFTSRNLTKSQENSIINFIDISNSSRTHSLKNIDDDVVVNKLISQFASKMNQGNNFNLPKNIAPEFFSQHSQDKTNPDSLKNPSIEQDETTLYDKHSAHNSTESADDIATAIVSLLSKKIADSQFDLSKNNKLSEADKKLLYNTKNCDCSNQLTKPCVGPIQNLCLEPSRPCKSPSCQVYLKITDPGNECLSLLNGYRKRHGAIDLKWSHDLYNKALILGRRIAFQNIPSKSLAYFEKPGVNIGYVSLHKNNFIKTPCAKALENWYSQKKNFQYANPKVTMNNQEFIQMIWKSSERVGIAQVESADKTASYVVAVYDPARNNNSDTRANSKYPSFVPVADIVIDLNTTTKKSVRA